MMATTGLKLASIIEKEGKKYYPIIRTAEANASIMLDIDAEYAEALKKRNAKTFSLWAKQALQRPDDHEPKPGELVLEVRVIDGKRFFSGGSAYALSDIIRMVHAAEILGVSSTSITNYKREGVFSELWMPGGRTSYISAKELQDPEIRAKIADRKRQYHPPIRRNRRKRPKIPKKRTIGKSRYQGRPCYALPPKILAQRLKKPDQETEHYFFELLDCVMHPTKRPRWFLFYEADRATMDAIRQGTTLDQRI